ncbi:LTA synthase family protein [Halobacillus naozhouensis]|uniref:LTA synthase family protein n=1 Tax=Halobacillus naozhouensis TaxID=554880 RepID=A0ABY8IVP8_9BACI|nr:LTA synthase family protein [Halobacillus naozhouensis]WFT73254.1 LTA synthase family protein [Halobacillus naozhouensis]
MKWNKPRIPLFVIASFLFGLKTYFVYRFMFELTIENALQEFILFFNPIASAYLIFAISVWLKPKNQMKYLRWTAVIGSLVLYINLLFYRNFTDFITIPVLFQGNNAADLTTSIFTLIHLGDLLLFADVVIIWILTSKKTMDLSVNFSKSGKIAATAVTFLMLSGNVALAELERPMLFVRAFDREYLVKNIGVYNYHMYDAMMQTKTKAQRVFADSSEISEIKNYINENSDTDEKSELFGIAEDKNVIFVSIESFQNFLLDSEINGKETTPFLNDLKESEETIWFKNFYHQTAQGKTSDSEFIVENSLYPLGRGAVYFTHAQNEYHALPEILNSHGYTTSVFHANNKSFWNRDVMYDTMGYDKFYGEQAYEVTKENSFGWGLGDKAFFSQSIDELKQQEKPFYSKFITLTNHFPFELPEDEANIDKYDSSSETLNSYFQTARYTDEALKQFFQQLKDAGIYKDSVIILMGDHYGISEFHNSAMGDFLNKEITPYQHIQLQRVPFMVHIPGYKNGEIREEVVGQIDVKPTLLSLLGIKAEKDLSFGTDMFLDDQQKFTALRDGSFITEKYVYTEGTCYDRQTGEPIQSEKQVCKPIKQKVEKELEYSDNIIYGDLFRFYDFTNKDSE